MKNLNLEVFDYPYHKENCSPKKLLFPTGDMIISHDLKTANWWDYKFITDIYRTVSKSKDSSYVDVGANIGTSSILASDYFSEIHAFEIDEENCSIYTEAMKINNYTSYDLQQIAVTEKSQGYSEIYKSPTNIGGHSIALQDNNVATSIHVSNVCLDDALYHVNNCTFLHIDTQGHDLKVLNGAYDFIGRQKAKPAIEFEFAPYLLAKHNSNPTELFAFMDFYNYKIFMNAHNTLAYISHKVIVEFFEQWQKQYLSRKWQFPITGWFDFYLIPEE